MELFLLVKGEIKKLINDSVSQFNINIILFLSLNKGIFSKGTKRKSRRKGKRSGKGKRVYGYKGKSEGKLRKVFCVGKGLM